MNCYYTVFLLLFALFACSDKKMGVVVIEEPTIIPVAKDSINYLALGDSYTIGQSVSEADRYPVELVNQLKNYGLYFKSTKIIAKTGWRTDNLLAAINQQKLDSNWQLVTLLIGVNNQYQGKSVSEYKIEFEVLLQRAIALAKGKKERVFVLSIPDYAFTPYGKSADGATISKELDEFNAINKQITEAKGVVYFDITPISRKGLSEPDLVANDGLHPSGKMYSLWVNLIKDTIGKVLK